MFKNKIYEKKGLEEVVIFDIDNTLIKGQSQKHFIDYLFKLKILSFFSYTKIIFWFVLYKLNLTNNPKKIIEYALKKLIQNKREDYIKNITQQFFEKKLINFFYKDALDLINYHKEKGRKIILVSNAIDIIVSEISKYLEINDYLCTYLEKNNGIYTGKIKGQINYGKNKAVNIKTFFKNKHLSFSKSWGYGDHFSDIFMLNLVKYPSVVNPDKKLKKEVKKKGWSILLFKKTT